MEPCAVCKPWIISFYKNRCLVTVCPYWWFYMFLSQLTVILIIEFSYKAEFRAKNSRKYEKKKLLHLHFQQTRNNTASPPKSL